MNDQIISIEFIVCEVQMNNKLNAVQFVLLLHCCFKINYNDVKHQYKTAHMSNGSTSKLLREIVRMDPSV